MTWSGLNRNVSAFGGIELLCVSPVRGYEPGRRSLACRRHGGGMDGRGAAAQGEETVVPVSPPGPSLLEPRTTPRSTGMGVVLSVLRLRRCRRHR